MNAIQKTPQTVQLSEYLRKPEMIERFDEVLGSRQGRPYVQSVLIAVSASPDLMQCTNHSVCRAALRAATLGLSCDPALKQAWLVPYNRKIKDSQGGEKWVKEAQFQPHYKGLYTLAMRTGKYLQINVNPIYDGQRVLENSLTGLHMIKEGDSVGQPDGYNPAYTDVTARRRKEKKIIGWLGYFRARNGFEKSVYMSTAEIDDHARKYVRDYDKNPNWNDAEKRQVMEMKTVLRQLLSWADLSGHENAALAEALQADTETPETIEGETIPVAETPVKMDYDTAKQVVVKVGKGEKFMGELDAESLNKITISANATEEQKNAAYVVLNHDFGFFEDEKKPKSREDNLKELGF